MIFDDNLKDCWSGIKFIILIWFLKPPCWPSSAGPQLTGREKRPTKSTQLCVLRYSNKFLLIVTLVKCPFLLLFTVWGVSMYIVLDQYIIRHRCSGLNWAFWYIVTISLFDWIFANSSFEDVFLFFLLTDNSNSLPNIFFVYHKIYFPSLLLSANWLYHPQRFSPNWQTGEARQPITETALPKKQKNGVLQPRAPISNNLE